MLNFQNNFILDIKWHYDVVQPLIGRARFIQGKLMGQMETLAYALKTEAHAEFIATEVLYICGINEENADYKNAHKDLLNYFSFESSSQLQINPVLKTVAAILIEEALNTDIYIDEVIINKWYEQLRMSDTSGINETAFTAHADFKEQIKLFSEWYNYNGPMDELLKAAICLLVCNKIPASNTISNIISYLLTIRLLALSENTCQRYYAVSQVFRLKNIEKIINTTNLVSENDVTAYLVSFTEIFLKALVNSTQTLGKVLLKNDYWNNMSTKHLSPRQEKVLCYMKEQKIDTISTGTWAVVGSCSADSALRDLQDLMIKKIIVKSKSGGRSTKYMLNNK